MTTVPQETIARALDVVQADLALHRLQHILTRMVEVGDQEAIDYYTVEVTAAEITLETTLDAFLPTQPDPEALITQDGQVVRAYLVRRGPA
jgi:hypothetical protein